MSPAASSLVGAVGWTLVHFAWQGLLLGCATGVALTVMRNARPEHRYTLACTALFLCLAWPAFELAHRLGGAEAAGPAVLLAAAAALTSADGAGGGLLAYLQAQLAWIVGIWAVCAGVLALRMGLGLLWVRQAARHDPDPQWQACVARLAGRFGVTRTVRLRVVQHLASPVTAGWWRPVVLVPAALISGMPPHLLEALLAHEMAHVKRLDYLVNLAQNVVEILLFYHPAVWWISSQVRLEREQVADDLAAGVLGEPRRLALALSELERVQFSTHHLAQAANGGDLMARIKRLIRPDTRALDWKSAIPVLGLMAALAGCAGVASDNSTPAPVAAAVPTTKAVAQFNSCKKPEYPVQSLRDRHTGTVTLGFLVAANGNVMDSTLDRSSGYAPLDDAARTAIGRCRFTPATRAGQAVQDWVKIQYVWKID